MKAAAENSSKRSYLEQSESTGEYSAVVSRDVLNFDPAAPRWANRDRFILSAGHGSMLLYSLLYLTGNPSMTIDQIKNFRQLGSLTPGHPENFVTPGIETTTGPLGQGITNAVGMAIAEKAMADIISGAIQVHDYMADNKCPVE